MDAVGSGNFGSRSFFFVVPGMFDRWEVQALFTTRWR
jgi:hypothetical protein